MSGLLFSSANILQSVHFLLWGLIYEARAPRLGLYFVSVLECGIVWLKAWQFDASVNNIGLNNALKDAFLSIYEKNKSVRDFLKSKCDINIKFL